MSKRDISALLAGLLFALGLGLAGMTNPNNVLGFLDVTGDWNPALGFVMAGALAVHTVFVRFAKRRDAPVFEGRFAWPTRADIDSRLLLGAILFGVGWGLSGYCPGPAVVSLVTLSPSVLVFMLSMLVAMVIAGRLSAAPRADALSVGASEPQ